MRGTMRSLGTAMWGSLALIAWTHLGYPAVVAVAASRARRDKPEPPAALPSVALVIAAHNEQGVIGTRLENALALDYPEDLLQIAVSLDGCTDATRDVVEQFRARGVALIENDRAGKVAAQNAAVRETSSDVVAFSDANSMWHRDALLRLVEPFADPSTGYVCGRLRLVHPATEQSVEGVYWRYELWLREQESRLGWITAGNGAIYAVRRSAYMELAPAHSHDIGLPFRLQRDGRRSVYEPGAIAEERVAPSTSAEWERKVRMLSRSWYDVLRGGMLDPRGFPPGYYFALTSHRLLRYASGVLHLVAVGAALAGGRGTGARTVLAGHGALLGLALAGRAGRPPRRLGALAWYYLVVTAASLAGLLRMIRRGPQITWTPVEGTR